MAQQSEPLGASRDVEGQPSRLAKVVEVIGTSSQGFDDALRTAVKDASQTIRHIHGCDVVRRSVSCEDGRITSYRVDLRIAFGVER